jgi:hypothetical protein
VTNQRREPGLSPRCYGASLTRGYPYNSSVSAPEENLRQSRTALDSGPSVPSSDLSPLNSSPRTDSR